MASNILIFTVLFLHSKFGRAELNLFCPGENKEIQCHGEDVIGVDSVIYGRFVSFPCYNDTLPSGTCNGSVEAREYVENQCSDKKSCLLEFADDFGDCSFDLRPYALVFTMCLSAPHNIPAFTKNSTCNDQLRKDILKDNIGLLVGIAVAFVILLAITSVISYCVGSHCHKKTQIYMDLTKDRKENFAQYTAIDENLEHNSKRDESHYTIPNADETYTYPNSVESNVVINSSPETNTNNKSINVLNEPYYFEPLPE